MSQAIINVMAVFAVLGAIDRILGNRFGLGAQFEAAAHTAGSLILAMVGIIALSPLLADLMKPVIVPVFTFLGADPAIFAGTILANDLGGAALARDLALTKDAGDFGGLIVSSMMGGTIVFTIPTSLGIAKKEDHKFLATGILAGVITIPIGCLVGGLTAGYPLSMVLSNLFPIILLSLLISFGLWKFPSFMTKLFTWFGKFVEIVITIGFAAGIVEALTGLVLIPGMVSISGSFTTIGSIVILLAGALPFLHVLTKVLRKPLMALGKLMGINEVSALGLVSSLANSIPTFGMLKDMDDRGKVINMAFSVSAAFVFGDHLAFTAGFNSDLIMPVIIGKLVGGFTSILLALWITHPKTTK